MGYDMEYSGFGFDSIRTLRAQSRCLDLAGLVRVPAVHHQLIAAVLDLETGSTIAP